LSPAADPSPHRRTLRVMAEFQEPPIGTVNIPTRTTGDRRSLNTISLSATRVIRSRCPPPPTRGRWSIDSNNHPALVEQVQAQPL